MLVDNRASTADGQLDLRAAGDDAGEHMRHVCPWDLGPYQIGGETGHPRR